MREQSRHALSRKLHVLWVEVKFHSRLRYVFICKHNKDISGRILLL